MNTFLPESRPLEFRAWHIPTQTMHYGVSFNNDFVFHAWDDSKSDDENYKVVDRHMKREDCVLMQFTGVLDENGKKIYEHDFFAWQLQEEDYGPDPVGWYYYVTFFKGAFVTNRCSDASPLVDVQSSTAEGPFMGYVVGNMLEHPQLYQCIDRFDPFPFDQMPHLELVDSLII